MRRLAIVTIQVRRARDGKQWPCESQERTHKMGTVSCAVVTGQGADRPPPLQPAPIPVHEEHLRSYHGASGIVAVALASRQCVERVSQVTGVTEAKAAMQSKNRRLRWLVVATGAFALLAVSFAPSWRNYYLPRRTVRIVEDVPYVLGRSDSKHQLDLYLPRTRQDPWPVIVFVHGGFWKPFDRRMLQPLTGLHGCVGVALANAGIATAVVSYRQRPEAASIQDALDDVALAIRYVVDNIGREGGDPARVYVVGHSAGALLTALLALEPDHLGKAGVPVGHVRGFAALAGPYDLARLASFADSGLASEVKASASGSEIERYSPERQVRPGYPPMLLLVGADEGPSMLGEQRSMAAALRKVGDNVTTAELPGTDHMGLIMHLSRTGSRARSELLTFIEKHR